MRHLSNEAPNGIGTRRRLDTVALVALIAYAAGYAAGPVIAQSGSSAVQLMAGQIVASIAVVAVVSGAGIPLSLTRGRSNWRTPASLAFGMLVGAAAGAFAVGVAALLEIEVIGHPALGVGSSVLLGLAAVVVGAAVSEELMFRHVLYRFMRYTRGTFPSIILSSLIFAAAHTSRIGEPVILLSLTLAGLMLAGLYRRNGFAGAVGGHAGYNLIVASSVIAAFP